MLRSVCLASVLLSAVSCTTPGELEWGDSPSAELELNRLNNRLVEAYVQEDVATLEELLAEAHVHNNVFGVVLDKATFLEDIRSGTLVFDRYKTPEIRWVIRDDIAVATGRIEAEARRAGKPVPATRFIFTRIYGRERGEWKVLLFHNTMAKQ